MPPPICQRLKAHLRRDAIVSPLNAREVRIRGIVAARIGIGRLAIGDVVHDQLHRELLAEIVAQCRVYDLPVADAPDVPCIRRLIDIELALAVNQDLDERV